MCMFNMFSIGVLYQKSKMFLTLRLNYVKNTKDPLNFVFNSESANIKTIYSAIYFWSKPRAGAIMFN